MRKNHIRYYVFLLAFTFWGVAGAHAQRYYADIRECVSQGHLQIDSIHGISDEKPNCGMAIVMRVRSVVAWDIRTVVVRGQILDSRNSAVQDMIVGESTDINVSARSTEEIGLNVFCIEVNDHPPGTSDHYDLGPRVESPLDQDDTALNAMGLGGAKGRDLANVLRTVDTHGLQGDGAAQNAVWTITDDLDEEKLLRKPFGAVSALTDGGEFDAVAQSTQGILDEANVDRRFDLSNLDASNYNQTIAANSVPLIAETIFDLNKADIQALIDGAGPMIIIGLVVFLIIVAILHRKKQKSTFFCYVLWFLFGAVGFHKFYLRKTLVGVLYILTGGFFLLGLLLDLFTIPGQVRRFNESL